MKHWIETNSDGEKVARYLYDGPRIFGILALPKRYKPSSVEEARAGMVEYYQRKELPVPEEYLSKEQRDVILARRAYKTMDEYYRSQNRSVPIESRNDEAWHQYPEFDYVATRPAFNPKVTMDTEITAKMPGLAKNDERKCVPLFDSTDYSKLREQTNDKEVRE